MIRGRVNNAAVMHVSIGRSTIQLRDAHVQRLVSVVKMATVLEEYTSEVQLFLVRILFVEERTQCKGYL
jgi:hypothetical protein